MKTSHQLIIITLTLWTVFGIWPWAHCYLKKFKSRSHRVVFIALCGPFVWFAELLAVIGTAMEKLTDSTFFKEDK